MNLDIPLKSGGTKKYSITKLLFKDGTVTSKNAKAKMLEIFQNEGSTAGLKYADPILFQPITQVMLLKTFIPIIPPKGEWQFAPWGEYSVTGGPVYGWITKLKFKTAVKFYTENTGKKEQDLKNYCSNFINEMKNQNGKSVYTRWLNGEVFGD